MSNQVVVQGTDAINFSGMSNVKSFIPSEDGEYAVQSKSTVFYHHGDFPLHQVLIFNTAPLNTGDSEKWYFSVSNKQGITVTGKAGKPIYVFLVDQVSSTDNTGSATVTFTKL